MDSRERTLLSLNREEPDRVPLDFWTSRAERAKIEDALGLDYQVFLDQSGIDLRYIDGPTYVGPPLGTDKGETDTDLWGVPRRSISVAVNDGTAGFIESYKEVMSSPLRECGTPEELAEYSHWPSPDWFDYSVVEAQCDRIREQGRMVVFMGDRLNRLAQLKPAMYLRGTEEIFIDLAERPEIATFLFEKIGGFYLEYGRRILESAKGKIDIVCSGDDFGSQMGLLISPEMWDRFLRLGFTEYIKLGKEYGAHVMHHTCGAVFELIPRFIESGLDILQSLQPEAVGMGARRLKSEFGDALCFQGGVSIQEALPSGETAHIRAHVQELMEAMAPGGGFIASTSHNIQADVSMNAIETLLEAYRVFGRYR